MNVYRYQVYTADRQIVNGEIAAISEDNAEQAIYRMGHRRILSLKPRGIRMVDRIVTELTKRKVTDREIMEFSSELAQLLESGIALMKALDFVADVTKNKTLKKMLEEIIDSINNGNSFSHAIAEQEDVFSETYIQVIRASEQSGNLEKGLVYMADFMNKQIETKKRLKRVFSYPAVILTMAFAIGLFLVFYIMPQMSDVFRSMDAELPAITSVMISVSDFAVENVLMLLVGIIVVVLVVWLYLLTERGRRNLDQLLLRIPVVSGMVQASNLLTYFYMSAMLLKSGLKLPQVLYYAGNTVGNRGLRENLLKMRSQVLQGQSLTSVIRQTGIFSRMEVEKIAIGERTGDIANAFENIAANQEKALEEKRTAFVATIEPAITICIGIVVALIALSTILPMYSLAGSFG